jgi:hypothetical protein
MENNDDTTRVVDKMHRLNVDITESLWAMLVNESDRLGITASSLVKIALDNYIKQTASR